MENEIKNQEADVYAGLRKSKDEEYDWYMHEPWETFVPYEGEWIAIHKQSIVAHDADVGKLLKRVKKYKVGELLLTYIRDDVEVL